MKQKLFLLSFIIFSLLQFITTDALAQEEHIPHQFSGMVLDSDDLLPLQYVNIYLKGGHTGTSTDFFGYFSIIAEEGDTLLFSSLGYLPVQFVIPRGLKEYQLSMIEIMQPRTNLLDEIKIYDWPTLEQFKESFLTHDPKDIHNSISINQLSELEKKRRSNQLIVDANMNQDILFGNYSTRIYNAGNLGNNNLFNPLAWIKFVDSWKSGKLSK